MAFYTSLLRPLLFRLDAETAHHGTIEAFHWLGVIPGVPALSRMLLDTNEPRLHTEAARLTFTSPIGLAAGWDKSRRALRMIDSLGFVICFDPPLGNPDTLQFTTPHETFAHQPGAVAGKPVESHINRCIAGLSQRLDRQKHILIGTGGILTAEDTYRKIRLGVSLVQCCTALIYEGPNLVKHITHGLAQLMERDGYKSVSEAVGTGHRSFTLS